MAAINFSNEKSIKASFTKEKSINTNVANLNYIPVYKEYEKERQENEKERQKYYEEFKEKVDNGELNGKSLEYNWDGTKLGVREEGQTTYEYVELKGDTGEAGETGPKGDTGDSGVYIGTEEPTNGANVWIDPDENPINDYVTRTELEELLGVIENGSY